MGSSTAISITHPLLTWLSQLLEYISARVLKFTVLLFVIDSEKDVEEIDECKESVVVPVFDACTDLVRFNWEFTASETYPCVLFPSSISVLQILLYLYQKPWVFLTMMSDCHHSAFITTILVLQRQHLSWHVPPYLLDHRTYKPSFQDLFRDVSLLNSYHPIFAYFHLLSWCELRKQKHEHVQYVVFAQTVLHRK